MALLAEHGVEQLPVSDGPDACYLRGMVGQDKMIRRIQFRELEALHAAWASPSRREPAQGLRHRRGIRHGEQHQRRRPASGRRSRRTDGAPPVRPSGPTRP